MRFQIIILQIKLSYSVMARSLIMRQMDEKTTDQEVKLMVWSPKMDILALAFSSGSISLHRLQWQKIWTAEPGEEEVVVGALAWRPDGKLLAAGDSAGVLTIRHIETSTALHTEQVTGLLDIRVLHYHWSRSVDWLISCL